MKKIRNTIYYLSLPLLFAFSFILTNYTKNYNLLYFSDIYRSLIIISLITILLFFVLNLIFKKKLKTSLFFSIFIILFFSFRGIYEFLDRKLVSFIYGELLILLLITILIIFLSIVIFKTNRNLQTLYKYFYFIALVSFIFPLIVIIYYQFTVKIPKISSDLALPEISSVEKKPDIYLIVPDCYPSFDSLQTHFSFDNTAFANELEEKGFFVNYNAKSNYLTTAQSLASILNMEYLDYLEKYKDYSDLRLLDQLIHDSNVKRIVQALGYKYYNLGGWWPATEYDPLADENMTFQKNRNYKLDYFGYSIVESSMLRLLVDNLPFYHFWRSSDGKREQTLYQFERIKEIAHFDSPKFVLMHILSPHIPFVFYDDCSYADPGRIRNSADSNKTQLIEIAFIDQIKCINLKLLDSIDYIIEHSKNDVIIVLLSDEGAPFEGYLLSKEEDWSELDNNIINQKLSVLSAYYFSQKNEEASPPETSSVNAFRYIFSNYFDMDFSLLENKYYYFPGQNKVFDFQEILIDLSD